MEINICGNCKNFRIHYIRESRGRYFALIYGHCVKHLRKKILAKKFSDAKACPYWQQKI